MVERKDVDEMKNLMNLAQGLEIPTSQSNSNPPTQKPFNPSVTDDPEMDRFLGAVSLLTEGMTNAAKSADLAAEYDPELKEALDTSADDTGVKIGRWRINIREEQRRIGKKTDKFYDIVHSSTGDLVAADLAVYEAAHGIVKLMNKGYMVNSRPIMELLREDEKFYSQREDARIFTVKALTEERRGNEDKQDLFEARLDYAKEQAHNARNRISKIVKTTR